MTKIDTKEIRKEYPLLRHIDVQNLCDAYDEAQKEIDYLFKCTKADCHRISTLEALLKEVCGNYLEGDIEERIQKELGEG